MIFGIKATSTDNYTDLLQYWAYGMQEQTNAIQGPNQGINILGHEILDTIAEKRSITFQSMPMTITDARAIRNIVSRSKFWVQSDLWAGTTEDLMMKATSRVMSVTRHNSQTGVTKVVLSFTMEEVS